MDERVFGQYRVTGVLGEGGMGIVYSAEHTLLDRPAAIKVLLPKLSGEKEIVQRFFNEARAATAIRHPGIVEVYDFGWTTDRERAAYIVMELLEGETLRARRKRGPLRWSTALALARQIAGALAAAHAKGIVHRDLKPDNIFLVPDDDIPGGERIKLLDFGIARIASVAPGQHKTRTGMVMGTPTYMAPEQCRGIAVDARADLYSVGCILFELCTGRPPFVGEGEGDVLVAHIHTSPPAMATLASGIPREVESLVQRLLAKSPADRVQSADELLRLIDAARTAIGQAGMSGQHPVLSRPPGADAEHEADRDHDAPTSADREETQDARAEPTMDVRSSSRRPRRDAVAPAPPAAKTDALATTEMASSPRLRTTLSSAAGTISLDGPLDEPPAASRRLKLIGGIGGGVAAFGVLALVFATLLGGNDDAPIQAAAAPPSETAPPAAAEPAPPGGPMTPPPTEVTPSPPPATPSAPPPTPTSPAPPSAKEAPNPPPAAAPSAKAPPAAAPAPKSPAAEKPATKSPSKPEAQAGGSLPPAGSGPTSPAKPSGPQATQVTIHIESSPPGAGIYRGDSFFGPTPRDFGLERGDYDYKLELRLPGYQPYEFTVHPTQSIRIPLMKLKRLPKPTPSSQTPPAPQPASEAAPASAPPQPAAPAP